LQLAIKYNILIHSAIKILETKEQLTNNSTWQICSISKQFATVACFKLIEEGKLSLQDKISKYFDNLPESYGEITVYNLLSMTSGIKDYINEKGLFGKTWESVEKEIFSDSQNFKPGDSWSYSNTNFWMVAKIIEKITGIKYNAYLTQNFFSKLEMNSSRQFSDTANIESIVKGYVYNDNQFSPPYLNFTKFQGEGDGEIISTLTDLFKWNNALAHGRIINNQLLSKMWTCSKLNNGENIEIIPNSGMNYGMGWFMKYIDGNKIVWTPGSGFWLFNLIAIFARLRPDNYCICNLMEEFMYESIHQPDPQNPYPKRGNPLPTGENLLG